MKIGGFVFLIGLWGTGFRTGADVQFTEAEVHQHRLMVARIADGAAKCLDNLYAEHLEFFDLWHVSKFYGNRRSDYRTPAGRVAAMVRKGIPRKKAEQIAKLQKGTACITMALDCLGQGFAEAGMSSTWSKIYKELARGNKFYGTDLQIILRQLGWKTYYWNPDPSQNAAWDREDRRLNPLKPGRKWNPVWGGHEERFREVKNKGSYYGIPIDDSVKLVGFGEGRPAGFEQVRFFIGTAHSGYHVFPGRGGDVVEAHSTREIDSVDNIQFSFFSPLADGGGPRWTERERYRSGVIVVPEGF